MQQNQNEKLINLYFEMYINLLMVTTAGYDATIFIHELYH
jgi:hypothetical protein